VPGEEEHDEEHDEDQGHEQPKGKPVPGEEVSHDSPPANHVDGVALA
jgi:hypothetical protein